MTASVSRVGGADDAGGGKGAGAAIWDSGTGWLVMTGVMGEGRMGNIWGWVLGSGKGVEEKERSVSETGGGMDACNRWIVSLSRLRSSAWRSMVAWNDTCYVAT